MNVFFSFFLFSVLCGRLSGQLLGNT